MQLSKCLIRTGIRQVKSDICMYSILDSHGNICGFVIVHVGDLLYAATFEFLHLVKNTISQFRVGDLDVSTQAKRITYAGLEIQKGPIGSTILPQETYLVELPFVYISRYVSREKLKMRAN